MSKIFLKTNVNAKMSASGLVHVSEAPGKSVPGSALGKVYEMEAIDKSHPPIKVQLISFQRFNLGSAIDQHTIPSHGIDACDFINQYLQENPDADHGKMMAAYYYKKVTDGNSNESSD